MKILMMIPVYRRPEILLTFLRLFNAPDYAEVRPLFILSPDDPELEYNQELVKDYDYLIYKNHPLGEKKNAGLRHALQWDWDFYMDMGSDNVWATGFWDIMKSHFATSKYFGIKNCHIYDTVKNEAYFLDGYHKVIKGRAEVPTALGVGRVVARSIIEDIGDLWGDNMIWGMDGNSHAIITKAGYECFVIDNGDAPIMLDIKSRVQMSPGKEVRHEAAKFVEPAWIRDVFGLDGAECPVKLITLDGFHDEVLKRSNDVPFRRDAFNTVNAEYERAFGRVKYKNWETYKSTVSRMARR